MFSSFAKAAKNTVPAHIPIVLFLQQRGKIMSSNDYQ